MSAPVVRAAGYIRVSTAEQALRGENLLVGDVDGDAV